MSAFVVSTITMNRIVTFILDSHLETFAGIKLGNGDVKGEQIAGALIGRALFGLNQDAVNYRYDERSEQAPRYVFKRTPASKIQVHKSLSCLLYQCSEGDVPERSAFKELDVLHNDLAHDIVNDLPEYDQAEWG